MEFTATFFISSVLILLGILGGLGALVVMFFQKVEQGKALIVNTMRTEPIVTFTGRIVIPVVHKSEVMDISLKTIEIDRRGRDGLICRDNIRADIKVAFFVRVNKTQQDVLKVAQAIGCTRASDHETLEELFSAKFSEALKTVGKQLDFEDLYKERESFRDKIIEVIGKDLNGYGLEDAAIDYLEQTPLSSLDPDNILDSQGIRKITELTSIQHVYTNELENQEMMKITQQNVTAKEAILEMERRKADAEAKQAREIANTRAREAAETAVVSEEERKRSEDARISAQEQIDIREKNRQREVEVAEQNRLRVVGIEEERVKLAKEQEQVSREREIELQRIAKEKAIEEERRDIAHVIRERVAVEKTVAEEEERTKEVRVVAEAERNKKAIIIGAEAAAEEILVKDIKAAEASQQASEFSIRESVARADAERDIADKTAQAKIRLAEGVQAEEAATGLAAVKVKEANAVAIEKQGIAEAKAHLEQMQAEALGKEKQGLADVAVKEANAVAIEKQGAAEAKAVELHGMAEVHIREAEADAIEKQGLAEARALQEHLQAEAAGLVEKFKALDALSVDGRAHEEFRIRLEQELKIMDAQLDAQKSIAARQAEVMGEALQQANIDIVGGDQLFFERMINSVSGAKALDGFVAKSETTQTALKEYLAEDGNLIQDIKEIFVNSSLSTQDMANMSLTAFLGKMMLAAKPEQRAKLETLNKWVQREGLE